MSLHDPITKADQHHTRSSVRVATAIICTTLGYSPQVGCGNPQQPNTDQENATFEGIDTGYRADTHQATTATPMKGGVP